MQETKTVTKTEAIEMKKSYEAGESQMDIAARYAALGYINRDGLPLNNNAVNYAINYTAAGRTKPSTIKIDSKIPTKKVTRAVALEMLKEHSSGNTQESIAQKYSNMGYLGFRGQKLTSQAVSYILKTKTKGRKPKGFSESERLQLTFEDSPAPVATKIVKPTSLMQAIIHDNVISDAKKVKMLKELSE